MDVNKVLQSNKLLTDIYLEIQSHFDTIYPNALVLMEIGTFFEIYESDGIGKAREIADLINIQLTRKNKSIIKVTSKNPLMAGFPNHAMERYLQKIIDEEKYTILVIKQKGLPPNVKRYLSDIISPGVNFDYVKKEENYLTSVIIENIIGYYHIGYACIDVTTGKSYVYEAYSSGDDKTYALDELFKLLQTYKSNEYLLTLDKNVSCEEIIRYLELEKKNVVYNSSRLKISCQNELLKKVYHLNALITPIELMNYEKMPLVSESLSHLLEFVITHNYKVLEKISKPTLIENDKYMYLGNNPIKQLNIEEVLSLIDKTSTGMGKRLLKSRLFSPIKDIDTLEKRYKMIEYVSDHASFFEAELIDIYDLERLDRKIKLQKLHPYEINFLYSSLNGVKNVYKKLKKRTEKIENFLIDIEATFNLEESAKVLLSDIKTSLFVQGYDKRLDTLLEELRVYESMLKEIAEKIESLFETSVSVSINELEKEGHFFSMTKNRFYLIKEKFNDTFLALTDQTLFFKDFRVKHLTNSVKITSDHVDSISEKIFSLRTKVISLTKELFIEKLKLFEECYDLLPYAKKIAEIDVSLSGHKVSKLYNHVKPTPKENTALSITDLRHPLIEKNQESGIYVPNSLYFNEYDGMLLYGINSSGKSSLMKSVGIAVMLAQSGFFVPAKEMVFTPFDALFTRIESRDNLAKGLSTFAVEMMELKNIFSRATKNSLVLGDEISHGTETLSALSIVASAIMKLSKLNANFIFATHLHQLTSLSEIRACKNVVSKHLSVYFDEKKSKLIYNRTLQEGNGSSVYGLEFAKSIYMDSEFLTTAETIRKQLSNDYNDLELIIQKKRSKYNKNLIVSTCAICGDVIDDVHHITEKSKADGDFIDHFHKHHKYNLIPLCKKHHNLVHKGKIQITGFVTTEDGIELHYDEKE